MPKWSLYDVTTVFLLLITVIVTQHYPCTALLWSLRRDVTDVILCLNKGPIVRQKANQMDIMSQASQLVKYNGLIARFFKIFWRKHLLEYVFWSKHLLEYVSQSSTNLLWAYSIMNPKPKQQLPSAKSHVRGRWKHMHTLYFPVDAEFIPISQTQLLFIYCDVQAWK